MFRRQNVVTCVCVLIALSFLLAAGPREADWKAVDQAIQKGLPKTAIERLEPIIADAKAQQRYAEAIRAIGMKVSLQGSIQGNRPEEKIARMRAEIAKAPAEMKPVMEAIVANWFWHYFRQNRWRFMQRSQTTAPPSEDFATWDLPRLLSEIDKQFQKSLGATEALQKIPIASYDDLFEKGSAPDAYRPTLFDVLAYNAIDFYSSGEQAASRVRDAFDLRADGPIFASANEFLAWDPDTNDQDSLNLSAISLYQSLLRFHRNDKDRTAFLDADRLRLRFGNNAAFGEQKTARYKAALNRFVKENDSHVVSAFAFHELATVAHGEGDWVESRDLATEGMNRHPGTPGANRCYNLIQQIEKKSSRITTERVWNAPRPTIDVHYRNVTKIYFRLVKFDFLDYVRSNRGQPEQLTSAQRPLTSRPAVKAWSEELPKTEDFKERIEPLATPEDVPAGSYFLIASHNVDFSHVDNKILVSEIWVSDLAIVLRNHQGTGLVDGFVLQANRGQPIAGATVKAWSQDNSRRMSPLPTTVTNEDGMFQFSAEHSGQFIMLATHKGQRLSSANFHSNRRTQGVRSSTQTRFFTDRSLYRPGQTIHYKGICLAVDPKQDNYNTISNRKLTVVFLDSGGKEIEQLQHRTNDFGSFSGSVTAPRDRLMGRMTFRVLDGPQGTTAVAVEEYKRPKFQVDLPPPKIAAKLNGEVKLQGSATGYNGAAINDAKVSWRVVRRVRYPRWWYWRCWWMPPQGNRTQEISHGTTITSSNGTFDITFTATPDVSVLEESEPTFTYTIDADVTDTTGETRSAQQTVRVGYTALAASMSADDWLTDDEPVEVRIKTTSLDGKGQTAKGTLKIFSVQQPDRVTRASLAGNRYRFRVSQDAGDRKPDPSNPNSWPLGEVVHETEFTSNDSGSTTVLVNFKAGMYRVQLVTKDRFGKAVAAELPIQVLDPQAKKLNLRLPHLYAAPKSSVEPDEEYQAIWGSGYDSARAYIEVEHRGKILQNFWTRPGQTQHTIRQKTNEAMRGGFTVRTTMVRENRAYMQSHRVDVPWTNKQLKLKWEHFVSKLEPAAQETWTAIVSGPDAEKHVAEMVATLYDASLDAYQPHHWPSGFNVFRRDVSQIHSRFENQTKHFQDLSYFRYVMLRNGTWTHRRFPAHLMQSQHSRGLVDMRANRRESRIDAKGLAYSVEVPSTENVARLSMLNSSDQSAAAMRVAPVVIGDAGAPGVAPDLSQVSVRKNLKETAFFFPRLIAGEDGTVKMQFTMPEALTKWKFLGFAHDSHLRSGLLTGTTVTAKDLMVQPNPPRFLREGDVVEFTVKVSNQSATRQTGSVRLTFADARTNHSVDAKLGNTNRDQDFQIPSGESKTLRWRIGVPDDLGFLIYKAVGSTGKLSDGEQGFLPVLSRRVLVTESLPLPIRGKQTKQFEFTKLLQSGDSNTLQNQSLTVQMVSNPAWYAVMALPYLMEYPHQCAEQTFNRLYANSLAQHIAASDPKIHRVFEQWRATPALDSPLEKNQDLKSVLLEETPWYRQAKSESQARRNVGILFDDNRLDQEVAQAMHRLKEMQRDDGAWPWFPGGSANDYITLYITTGFGRLRHLGADVDTSVAIKSLDRLDAWVTKKHAMMKPSQRKENHLSATIALYLYGRSFFLKDKPVSPQHTEAVNYWLDQAKTYGLDVAHRQSQAHLAVASKRFGNLQVAKAIMASIKERAVSDEELGMFWRDQEHSWWWYRAPIETQAMMIEAFDEVMNDQQAVEDCKIWLLKQKQTQDWKTTKATADAVYSLLLRGRDQLASDQLVDVSLAGSIIQPDKVEAGTGFYEQRFVREQVKPKLGEITVTKLDEGVAWGSVHWQYLEDISKITSHQDTPLQLTKQLFVKKNTNQGPILKAVDGAVNMGIEVGDELVVRIVLRTDRSMEYLHLKDHRGSGTEPVSVLSRYKFQDGLAYFESTRDTASHFFIDYLPKGTYVFEYSTRVQLRGEYQTGMASIQCMYAPEFNSHSESLPIVVK